MFALSAMDYTLKDENMKKCIKMVIIAIKIVIWAGESSVLWLQIAFYRSATVMHNVSNLTCI